MLLKILRQTHIEGLLYSFAEGLHFIKLQKANALEIIFVDLIPPYSKNLVKPYKRTYQLAAGSGKVQVIFKMLNM